MISTRGGILTPVMWEMWCGRLERKVPLGHSFVQYGQARLGGAFYALTGAISDLGFLTG